MDNKQNARLFYMNIITILFSLFVYFSAISLISFERQKAMDNILTYCESQTGKRQAQFANGGQFVACP